MPSRRRSRSKNLTNNLADVQRRLRFLERRPVRTRLANRVVTRAAIAPNSVSADEAEFGTAVVVEPGDTIDDTKAEIENPKDGLLVVDSNTGESQIYSENQEIYYDISDPVAQASADAAADSAVIANTAATNAQFTASSALTTAGNKNRVFYAVDQTALNAQAAADGYTLKAGDLWFDTDNDYRMSRYSGTAWGAFSLGDLALSAISAGKITAGTITLSQGITITADLTAGTSSLTINNSGIAAVNSDGVQTFSINSSGNAFFGGSLTAGISISSPQITLQNNNVGSGKFATDTVNNRRIEITDQDDIIFYNASTKIGLITGINTGWSGGEGDATYGISQGVQISAGATTPANGAATYPSLAVSADPGIVGAYVFGDSDTYLAAETGSVYTVGAGFASYADRIELNSGDSAGWYVRVGGPLVLTGAETVVQSTNPPTAAPTSGEDYTIRFHYT